MITFDKKDNQILTTACINCKDPYFAPAKATMIHAGCCSYSPVFSLHEINEILKNNGRDDFFRFIYTNAKATIMPYEVIVHAHVDPLFHKQKLDHLSTIDQDDIRLQYSVCQFFEPQKGCRLPPPYKNATCRSFICLTVEEQLDEAMKLKLKEWNTSIQKEVHAFNEKHRKTLQLKGFDLQNNVQEVVDYLQSEEKR